jgi:hypothetical protein
MSQDTFEVVFSGKLVEGAVPEQVKAKVAAMFKVEVAKVERLFSGASVSIKKGIDEPTAKKYQMALQQAGAICQVVNHAAVPATVIADPVVPAAAAAAPPLSSTELGLQKSVVKALPSGLGELGGVSIDEPGIILVEHQEAAVPQIDTDGLSMDPIGVELSEHETVAEPEVDISGLSMGEVGEVFGEEEPVEPLDVDTGALVMDEPGVTLVEHEEVAEPKIDTSKLSLD